MWFQANEDKWLKKRNKVDFIIGLGYKITKPTSIINMDAWADDNSNKYDYNPIVQELNINSTLAMQWSEKFSPYIYYSYGIIEAELFKPMTNPFPKS